MPISIRSIDVGNKTISKLLELHSLDSASGKPEMVIACSGFWTTREAANIKTHSVVIESFHLASN